MPIAQSAQVHPTALVGPEADVGDDVRIGPYVVVEGAVRLGAGCEVRAGAHLIGPLSLGRDNQVHSYAVLGGQPQHLLHAGDGSRVEVGDGNIFREHVTVHRATRAGGVTRIGGHNFFMAGSHVAHDCVVGSRCILANNALVGGHCVLEDSVYLSGNCALHQFVKVGRLALLSGVSASTKDMPPFMIQQRINRVVAVNVVGMRRAGVPTAHIDAVRRAFNILYHGGHVLPNALALVEQELGTVPEVMELVAFIRASTRGITLQTDRDAA
jgi:UDP-N-acetylglucosamine acyltransferase